MLLLIPNTVHAQSDIRLEIMRLEPFQNEYENIQFIDNVSKDAPLIHVVEIGDSLSTIAQAYQVEPANLAAYNQIIDFNHVVIGQKLRIPPVGVEITEPAEEIKDLMPGADGYHVVLKGESLSAIGRLYNLTLNEITELNDIADASTTQIGQMLRVTERVDPVAVASKVELSVINYVVQNQDTLASIAVSHSTTIKQILHDNELTADSTVRAGQELRILVPADAEQAFGVDAPVDGKRRIVIDLSEQMLTAYQGDVVVLESIVSTGKAATPTRVGEYATYLKYDSQTMSGDDYELPGVPWVMYYDDEYAIHGAYWHANFGTPTSHGCTNMTITESKALYTWAPLGTKVIVQD